jgi:hypothetical protein
MAYEIIQPPFGKNLRDMSKIELKQYFQWFVDILPRRIDGLADAVHETPGFESWQADLAPSSLSQLGDWFALQVETRRRSEAEMEEMKGKQAFPIEASNNELTNKTFSLAMDIGMYFGQVLLTNHPSLKWSQDISDKKFVDYGQPLLVGFGSVPLNPVGIVVVLAYGLVSGKRTGDRLRQLYDIWQNQIAAAS